MTLAQTKKVSSLTQKIRGKHRYGSLIGKSPPIDKIFQLLKTIKESDSTVLITGETGTERSLLQTPSITTVHEKQSYGLSKLCSYPERTHRK